MALLNPDSLACTLDGVAEALIEGVAIKQAERENVAIWLACRQGQPGSYRGFSAPTPDDFSKTHLFTGEALNSRASIAHILGEEAARCMVQLNVQHPEVQQAMKRNIEIVNGFETFRYGHRGFYCCTRCTVAYWRYLNVSGIPKADLHIRQGIKILSQTRDGNGRWRSFPFFYTLLTLYGLDMPEAAGEMRYALPACERVVQRPIGYDRYSVRRTKIARDVLEKYS